MVSLMVLSHSKKIVEGIQELAGEMSGGTEIFAVGGAKAGGLGSDFDATLEAMSAGVAKGDLIVLADMGSTRMTAEMALETLSEEDQKKVHFSNAAIVEGAVLAAVSIAGEMGVEDILEQLKDFDLDK